MSFWASVKNAWSESGVSLLKITSTALAAITVTLLSPKISAWTNSILTVGLISMISAILGASYSTMIALTTKGAKKVTKTVVEDDVFDEIVASTEVEEVEERPTIESIVEEAPRKAISAQQKRIKALAVYAVSFVIVSVLTVGGSWLAAQAATGGNSQVPLMKVLEGEHKLNEGTIEEISDLAASKVDTSGKVIEKNTIKEKENRDKEDEGQDDLDSESSSNSKDKEKGSDKDESGTLSDIDLDFLEKETSRIQELLKDLESQDYSSLVSKEEFDLLLDELASLNAQIEELDQRLSQLEIIEGQQTEEQPPNGSSIPPSAGLP